MKNDYDILFVELHDKQIDEYKQVYNDLVADGYIDSKLLYEDFIEILRNVRVEDGATTEEAFLLNSYKSLFFYLKLRHGNPAERMFKGSDKIRNEFIKRFEMNSDFFDSYPKEKVIEYCAKLAAKSNIQSKCDYPREYSSGYESVIFNHRDFSLDAFEDFYLNRENKELDFDFPMLFDDEIDSSKIDTGLDNSILEEFFQQLVDESKDINEEDILNFLGTYFKGFECREPFTKRFDLSGYGENKRGVCVATKIVTYQLIMEFKDIVKINNGKRIKNETYAILVEKVFAGFKYSENSDKTYPRHLSSIIKKFTQQSIILKLPNKTNYSLSTRR